MRIYQLIEIEKLAQVEKYKYWKNISKEQLEYLYVEENLSDSSLMELFDISEAKVKYKRNKYGIKFNDKVVKTFINQIPKELNDNSKQRILNNFNIDLFAKVITHYAFRNGPIEDMHANNQLSQDDMKTLNKFMVNRIAGILQLIKDNQWLKIETLIEMNKMFGSDWDVAVADIEDINTMLKLWCRK